MVRFGSRFGAGILVAMICIQPARQTAQQGQAGLKIVDNPGGGQFVYGSLTGQNSQADAMVYMLRQVHGHFGDRPQVGRLFQSLDGSSLATFFTLTAKTQGNTPMAGLVIVSSPKGKTPQAAVLYDDAKRFTSTEPAMMRSLGAAWGSSGPETAAPTSAGSGARQSSPERLSSMTGGDRSASISLPADWKVTGVSGGQLTAEGPRGEKVGLGLLYQGIIDPRNPQAQQTMRFSQGPHIVCALGTDMWANYVSVVNQIRSNRGMPAATLGLVSSRNLPGGNLEVGVIEAIFNADLHDGLGPRKGSARIGAIVTRGAPTWAMTVSTTNMPVTIADTESATMSAVIASYRQNNQVISAESRADMDRIHAQAAANQQQADAINARRDASTAAFDSHMKDLNQSSSNFNQHMDDIDRSGKGFQDYILDRSVVVDKDFNARGTITNSYADSLVKANPDRFQVVPNQDLIRGKDY